MSDVLAIHIVCTAVCRSSPCHATCHIFLLWRYLLPYQQGHGLCSLGILDTFAKLRKAILSFVNFRLSVRPSVCLHETTRFPQDGFFMKFDNWGFFENMLRKFKFQSNLTRITGTLYEELCTFVIPSRWTPLRMRSISDKSCRENQNIYLCPKTFFFFAKIEPFMR